MARVGRLAGSLLVETQARFFLVGYPKEPCDYRAHGLSAPPVPEQWKARAIQLEATSEVCLGSCVLTVELEAEPLLCLLEERLLVARNGSVSERLWRLVVGASDGNTQDGEHKARWLTEAPSQIWDIVRDAVLRCS